MIELPHLDLNITTVCNFRCASCSHGSPFSLPYWMKLETAGADLLKLSKVAHFEMLCLVGGEPTLHPEIVEFLKIAGNSPIADDIVVVTNGSKLDTMPDSFWNNIDVLRLSIYPKLPASVLEFAQAKCLKHDVTLLAWHYPEFFKQLKTNLDDGVESFKNCSWRSDCYTVHEGHFYLCPQSAFFPERLMRQKSTAGLPLDGITEETLQAFLDRTEPFEACKICCAGDKVLAPWKESTKKDWAKDSTL